MPTSNRLRATKKHHAAALLILNKLEKQALEGNVQAARVYLSKIMPDLKAVEHKGEIDHRIDVLIKRAD